MSRAGFAAALGPLALALLAPRPAFAAQPEPGDDEPASAYRSGPHFGIGIGPTASYYFNLSKDVYGVTTSFFMNLGALPALDVRAGLAAEASGSATSYLSIGAPVNVRVNLGSAYAVALGFSAGMVTNTEEVGFFAGPELTPLALRIGKRREFELELTQGAYFHLGGAPGQIDLVHLHASVVLSYLYLPDAP